MAAETVRAETARLQTVHATCVALWNAAVLIRGESGSGKSTLAAALLDRASAAGLPCALVADDRARLEARGGTLIATPHPTLAGLIEIRGLGLLRCALARDAAPVRLVVDLVESGPRLPAEAPARAMLLGIGLPRLVLDRPLSRSGLAPRLILDALARVEGVAAQSHSPLFMMPDRPGM